MQGRIEDLSHTHADVPRLQEGAPELPSARDQYRRLYRFVAGTDALSVGIGLLIAYWIRFGFGVPTPDFVLLLIVAPFAVVVVSIAFHLYQAHRYAPAEEFRSIILAVSLALAGLMTLSFWSKADLSRLWLGLSWTFAILLVLASRRVWHWWIGHERMRGRLAFRTLIVGTNEEGRRLEELMAKPAFGFRPIGLVAASGDDEAGRSDAPVLGRVDALRDLIRDTGAECVFVASSATSKDDLQHVAKAVRLESVEVRVTATLPDVLSSRLSVQPLGGVTALSLRPVRLSGTQMVAKFTFDIVISTLGLALLSPFMLAIALAIRLSSPGPVLYRQRRVGLRGRPFTMLKFRTMEAGADAMVEDLRRERGVEDLMFKLRDDPRVTRVGRFLRRYSLDELPQLLNVVRGHMSLVGPRPPLPQEVTRYEDWQFDRLEVPPGVTGLWQVSGRADLSFDDCVRLDLFYIENWSLAYDLYILAKTIPVLLSPRGAY